MKIFSVVVLVSAALMLGIIDARADLAGATSESESTSVAKSGAIAAPQQSVTLNSPGDITYRGGYAIYAPPPVAAPALTATLTDTCMGSWSAGLSVPGGGATFGKTQIDEDCVARLHARQLVAMSANGLAMEVLCSRRVVQDADLRMPREKRVCSDNIKPETATLSVREKVVIHDTIRRPVMPGR